MYLKVKESESVKVSLSRQRFFGPCRECGQHLKTGTPQATIPIRTRAETRQPIRTPISEKDAIYIQTAVEENLQTRHGSRSSLALYRIGAIPDRVSSWCTLTPWREILVSGRLHHPIQLLLVYTFMQKPLRLC